MVSIKIKVTGPQRVAQHVRGAATKIVSGFVQYVGTQRPFWEDLLKATIRHVVYDAYQPAEYQRTYALIDAVSSKAGAVGRNAARAVMYDDPAKVHLKQGGVSAGGSAKGDVPFEIETGDYPMPWYGFVHERPAYAIFADTIRPTVYRDAGEIVSQSLA